MGLGDEKTKQMDVDCLVAEIFAQDFLATYNKKALQRNYEVEWTLMFNLKLLYATLKNGDFTENLLYSIITDQAISDFSFTTIASIIQCRLP